MSKVFYLCGSQDDPRKLVFADELPEDYYAPGMFVVEAKSKGGALSTNFQFAARQGQQLLALELNTTERGRTFKVDANSIGMFYFKLIALNRTVRYAGIRPRSFNNRPLYRVEPANMTLLERACTEHDFYFIGARE